MRDALRSAQTLKALGVRQHLAALLGQGDDLTCKRRLPGHTDGTHLLGFLASGQTAEGRQTKGDASGILGLAHAVLLGHPKKRCDGIGADRQADMIEPESFSAVERVVKLGSKLLTQSG